MLVQSNVKCKIFQPTGSLECYWGSKCIYNQRIRYSWSTATLETAIVMAYKGSLVNLGPPGSPPRTMQTKGQALSLQTYSEPRGSLNRGAVSTPWKLLRDRLHSSQVYATATQ